MNKLQTCTEVAIGEIRICKRILDENVKEDGDFRREKNFKPADVC